MFLLWIWYHKNIVNLFLAEVSKSCIYNKNLIKQNVLGVPFSRKWLVVGGEMGIRLMSCDQYWNLF